MTKNIVIKKEDLNPSSRKSNEYRTTMGDVSRQQRTTPCPAVVTTPLAASTPTVLPPRKTCSSSATKFMQNESKLQGPRDLLIGDLTGQQDNYSVIPEDDPMLWNQSFGFEEALISCSEEFLMRPEKANLENQPVKHSDINNFNRSSNRSEHHVMGPPNGNPANNQYNRAVNKQPSCSKSLHQASNNTGRSTHSIQPDNIKRRRVEQNTAR